MGYKPTNQRPLLWRILIYVASAALLLLVYLGLLLLVGLFFPKAENQSLVAAFILVIIAAILLVPFQNLIHNWLEGSETPVAQRPRPPLPPLETMLVKLGQATSLDSLAIELTHLLRENMGVTFAAFALYTEVKRIEEEVRNFEFIKFDGEDKYEPFSRRLVFQPIQYFNTPELAQSETDHVHTGIIMKLKVGEHQRGLLCVGPHLDESEFKPADFLLLETLAGPISVMVHSTSQIRDMQKNITDLEKKIAEQKEEYGKLEQSRLELQMLNQKVVQDAEEERNTLVRELQSGPIEKIDQIIKQLELYAYDLSEREEMIWHLAQEADKTLATMTTRLRPASLDKLGLVAAIYRLVEDTRQRVKLSVKFNVGQELEVRRLPAEIELCLYRVAQEALQNVLDHARAQHVTISLSLNDATETVRLAVLDDGIGFNPPAQFATTDKPDNLGLAGIQERLTSLSGRLKVRSSPGAGAVIEAEVPLKRVRAGLG